MASMLERPLRFLLIALYSRMVRSLPVPVSMSDSSLSFGLADVDSSEIGSELMRPTKKLTDQQMVTPAMIEIR